jgi:xanthosine utilization system XapX-like protein
MKKYIICIGSSLLWGVIYTKIISKYPWDSRTFFLIFCAGIGGFAAILISSALKKLFGKKA